MKPLNAAGSVRLRAYLLEFVRRMTVPLIRLHDTCPSSPLRRRQTDYREEANCVMSGVVGTAHCWAEKRKRCSDTEVGLARVTASEVGAHDEVLVPAREACLEAIRCDRRPGAAGTSPEGLYWSVKGPC